MSDKPQNLIYGLIDPRTLLIRYVGQSSQGMQRPRSHRYVKNGAPSYCKNWIVSLQREGLLYEIAILEVIQSADDLDQAECWWIAFGKACDWPLTNIDPGGKGGSHTARAERRKQKALARERRANDRAARERRAALEREALETRNRLHLFSLIAEREGISAALLEYEFQERQQRDALWKRDVALAKAEIQRCRAAAKKVAKAATKP